jgi:hypothetical protein
MRTDFPAAPERSPDSERENCQVVQWKHLTRAPGKDASTVAAFAEAIFHLSKLSLAKRDGLR